MNRKEFIKICGILGIGLPLQTSLRAYRGDDISSGKGIQKVLIIGAGPAGLSAAYLLNQQGIDYQILEASSSYGGRTKRTTDFANFPIPLGAEWLHTQPEVFDQIVNDSSISVDVETKGYDPDTDFGWFKGRQISLAQVGFPQDRKFINSTWFDFFEQYIVPDITGNIHYNQVVSAVDYTGDQVLVSTGTTQFTADSVIITVPLKLLQDNTITFSPSLPSRKLDAIKNATVWDGCKAFIEFSEKFYPAFTAFDIRPRTAGQKLYYDASYGQETSQNILGLFAVGTGARPYIELSENALIDYMLKELDAIFDNQASAHYIKHIFQNWNAEPFARGAYVYDHENRRRIRTLGRSVNNKVFFAGTAYTDGSNWGSVDAAAQSAKRAVEEILKG